MRTPTMARMIGLASVIASDRRSTLTTPGSSAGRAARDREPDRLEDELVQILALLPCESFCLGAKLVIQQQRERAAEISSTINPSERGCRAGRSGWPPDRATPMGHRRSAERS